MQYIYHENASLSHISLVGDEHRYIFKVRRHRVGDIIDMRNLKDQILYSYSIDDMDKRRASLVLTSQRELMIEPKQPLHIGWCMIDPKNIEKVLPTLNEIGVSKITFIHCQRSQKNFKLEKIRLDKILLNSSQQCGRSSIMTIDEVDNLELFLSEYPDTYMLNFSSNIVSSATKIETIIVGSEGGLTLEESRSIDSNKIVALDTPMILRSESAVCAISSKLLL